jgi:uncharacterized protein DUF6878
MDDDTKRKALTLLRRYGIAKVTATFNGGGDSGNVDNIEVDGLVTEPEKIPLTADDVEVLGTGGQHNYDATTRMTTTVAPTLADFLDHLANELLSDTQMDWYNNDGGYGEITIVPGNDYIFVDMNLNEMTSDHHPLDLSLPEATDPPEDESAQPTEPVTPASKPEPQERDLGAVLTRLTLDGHITPSEHEKFRHVLVQAELYCWRAAEELKKHQKADPNG